MAQQQHEPAAGLPAHRAGCAGRGAGARELRAVQALVVAKATPEEAEAFGTWLVTAAQAAADAAKEGGFLGFGAKRVSAREQAMLDQVRAAVAVPPAPPENG